ncbi:MAG: glycosyltransferase family 2 protein [Dysgonamonadaceae bacterium]|jgi:glycosyltransferase involved in cell wall biosynthesis|nr:glycosyltransferase family 2 protein [Dysgonamonadaceae bacterium]
MDTHSDRIVRATVLTSLYNSELFIEDYLKALSLIEGKEMIEVLLLHNAPNEKEMEIINAYLPSLSFVKHIIIPQREFLYRTWNRGISLSQGEYITVWNVDDVRFPESIVQQIQALDDCPNAAVAYGDIWVSKVYGVCEGELTNSPSHNRKKDFFKAYHMSCFQMWRKSIHETIGYYDEQFRCSADFDFQIRAAIHFPFVKVKEVLGVYLDDQPFKISYNGCQQSENDIINLRYGAYERLNIFRVCSSKKKYRKNHHLFFDEWHPFTEESQFGLIYKAKGLFLSFFRSTIFEIKRIIKKMLYGKKTN